MPEPGGWELRRAVDETRQDMRESFAQLNLRLDKLVTTGAFEAEQRRVDEKITDLARALADEREARVRDLAEEKIARQDGDAAQQKALDKLTATQKWVAAAIVLPVALFIATLLLGTRGAA